ncbi:hypothetical protein COCON_G00233390 [Conger conger]|uniref:Family with sequence similarity 107 member B n=1 Tax=Conger conger TaxID=82655 RepID=A0A9Q1CW83_CONCO|nr:hypothetical protein COCON_G00233390 [Conger conger]
MLRYPVFALLKGPCQDVSGPQGALSRRPNTMAEPDYMDGDCDELIQPKKLINPVKTSRNHQDLHRELLMNQKRGLSPQNKPELQKVLERRKREQREEQEAREKREKRSDLELELLKRQQKLEQLELEQQKCEEEQENTPEFVKMKGNLRRTKHEAENQEHGVHGTSP